MNLDLGTQSVIAGAVFDFAAYLTAQPKRMVVGASEPVYDVLTELERWAMQRNLDLSDADVAGWDKTASVVTLAHLAENPARRRISGALRSYADFVSMSKSSDFENLLMRWASKTRLAVHDPQRAWAMHWWL